jgi:hypothetical protein
MIEQCLEPLNSLLGIQEQTREEKAFSGLDRDTHDTVKEFVVANVAAITNAVAKNKRGGTGLVGVF